MMEVDTDVAATVRDNPRDNLPDADHDNGALLVKNARTELVPKHEQDDGAPRRPSESMVAVPR